MLDKIFAKSSKIPNTSNAPKTGAPEQAGKIDEVKVKQQEQVARVDEPKDKPEAVRRFLYLDDEKVDGRGIILKSAVKDNLKNLNGEDKSLMKKIYEAIMGNNEEDTLDIFNSRINDLTRSKKHKAIPDDSPIGDAAGSKSNPLKPKMDDYITKGDTPKQFDTWENHMIADGKTYPLTILQGGAYNEAGFPEVMYLQKDMEFDGKFKNIWYVDPKTNKLTEGVYFEIKEKGAEKPNGIIVPKTLFPVAIIKVDEAKKDEKGSFSTQWDPKTRKHFKPTEAWFLGVDESREKLDPSVHLHVDATA